MTSHIMNSRQVAHVSMFQRDLRPNNPCPVGLQVGHESSTGAGAGQAAHSSAAAAVSPENHNNVKAMISDQQ